MTRNLALFLLAGVLALVHVLFAQGGAMTRLMAGEPLPVAPLTRIAPPGAAGGAGQAAPPARAPTPASAPPIADMPDPRPEDDAPRVE